jgi:chemotaxis protein histidine kinase CheA
MFGFDQLAAFTHNLENAFDEVRNERLEITPTLINLSLTALDEIKIMLEQPDGVAATIGASAAEIVAKLGRFDATEVGEFFAASYTTEVERDVLHAALRGTAMPVAQQSFAGNTVELF